MAIGRLLQRVPRDEHGARRLRLIEPQQEIGEAEDGAGRLAAAPEDRFRQRVIGAVGERIAVDDEQRPPARARSRAALAALAARRLRGVRATWRAASALGVGCRVAQHDPSRRMIAGARPLRARRDRRRRRPAAAAASRAQQQMIEAKPGIARPAVPHVVPERVHRLVRVQRADRIDPALIEQRRNSGAALRLHERVLRVGFRRVDVAVGRHDVEVAGQHDRHAGRVELGGVAARRSIQASL